MVLPSQLQFAAGVCVLAAGLLMGAAGGAVAVADPDSIGDDGTNASGQGSITANSPVGNVTDTVQKTISGATSTLGSSRQPGQPSTGATSPKKEPRGTDGKDETNSPAPVSEASDSGPVAAVPNPVAAVPNVVAPVTDVVAPVTDVGAPVTDVVAPVTDVVEPVSDVIAVVPDTPTSVPSAAVPPTQLPSDLSSFLLDIAGVAPVVDGMGGTDGGGLGAAAGASVASQLPLVPPVAGIPGVPLVGDATGVATLLLTTFEPTGVGRASSPPGMAPLEPDGGLPMGLHSFFRDAIAKLLLPVSLWALFTVALPGAAGLVVLTAIGVRVGYRQAKAGFVVRAAGITRLARPGQLGVVRSGALSAGSLLDKVA
jgi:hypothetical protein